MNVSLTSESPELTIEKARPFIDHAGQRVVSLLRESHAKCVDGTNKADMANNHRLGLVMGLPGLLLPTGPITADPRSEMSPKNTTWLRLPGADGDITFPINCVRFSKKAPNVYILTGSSVEDLADFDPLKSLFEVESAGDLRFLLALRWTYRPKDHSMSFLVKLLYGTYEARKRLFHAHAERNIAKLDTRTEEVRYGHGDVAAGPSPDLRPRRDK